MHDQREMVHNSIARKVRAKNISQEELLCLRNSPILIFAVGYPVAVIIAAMKNTVRFRLFRLNPVAIAVAARLPMKACAAAIATNKSLRFFH